VCFKVGIGCVASIGTDGRSTVHYCHTTSHASFTHPTNKTIQNKQLKTKNYRQQTNGRQRSAVRCRRTPTAHENRAAIVVLCQRRAGSGRGVCCRERCYLWYDSSCFILFHVVVVVVVVACYCMLFDLTQTQTRNNSAFIGTARSVGANSGGVAPLQEGDAKHCASSSDCEADRSIGQRMLLLLLLLFVCFVSFVLSVCD
jgi:hypothetical protein